MEKQSSFSTFETAELKKFHSALSRSPFTELVGNGTASKVELLTSCHLFCQMCFNLKEVKIPYLECYNLTTIYYLPSEPLEKEGDTFRLGTALVEGLLNFCNFPVGKSFCKVLKYFKVQCNISAISAAAFPLTFYLFPFTYSVGNQLFQSLKKKFKRIFHLALKQK